MLNKKAAKLIINETLELILAVAGIAIVVILLYNLIAPSFDSEDKTAEAYFNSFKQAIQTAEKGGTGVFEIWQPESTTNFYLIYFGTKVSYKKDNQEFFSLEKNINHACLCYSNEKEISCNYCENLPYPLKKEEQDNSFHIGANENINIIKLPNEEFFHIIKNE